MLGMPALPHRPISISSSDYSLYRPLAFCVMNCRWRGDMQRHLPAGDGFIIAALIVTGWRAPRLLQEKVSRLLAAWIDS